MKLLIPNENLLKIKDINIEAKTTDFAKVLGVGPKNENEYINNNSYYYLMDNNTNCLVKGVNGPTNIVFVNPTSRNLGIRLVVNFSDISKYCSNFRINQDSHIYKANCFMIPTSSIDIFLEEELEYRYQKRALTRVDHNITIDSEPINCLYPIIPKVQYLYKFKNKIYTRVQANLNDNINKKTKLSNGHIYKDKDFVWIKSCPIEWRINQEKNIAVTEDIILGGIQFDTKEKYKRKTNFEKTTLFNYLNNYISNELKKTVSDTRGKAYTKVKD